MEFFENDKYETELATNLNQLPTKLRPYNIEYRKMFSKHNHQAPELLSNRIGFVFPTIQSDVYGICLMLWEMLNCSIPFADFDYDEMKKLIYLQNAQLPVIRENRQKSFADVLEMGLNMLAEKRIPGTVDLNELLSKISLELEDKIDLSFEREKFISKKHPLDELKSLSYSKGFGPINSERTSTIKKRKHIFKDDRLTARQLFAYSHLHKTNQPNNMLVPSQTSSPNSPQYGFEIGEVSIPETPIARSNKLRKTAWLSNQSISPIVHLEIKSNADEDASNNQKEQVDKSIYNDFKSEHSPSNKLYNVNIRIRSKPDANQNNQPHQSTSMANDSPAQGQRNISQISDYIKFFNLVSQQNPTPVVHASTKTPTLLEKLVNYNTFDSKPVQATEKITNQQKSEPPASVDQSSINEFFSRNHTSDFETSLWRREKEKCDKVVNNQRRISVKDTVNKFESFSKSFPNESNSSKQRKTFDDKKKLDSNFEISKTNIPSGVGDCERNISKMNIVLQNRNDISKDNNIDEKKIEVKQTLKCFSDTEEKFETPELPNNKSPMLTLNFKKLDRRASDLGSYFIRQNPMTKGLTARHSIYGTEIFKRLRRSKPSSTKNENEEVSEKQMTNRAVMNKKLFQEKNKDFKIKVGKLTCLNCGHKLFVVDDIVPSSTGEDNLNESFSELLLAPLKRNFGLQQVAKSTEDFYIDDDFCEDFELCANMELGTQTHLSDLDFDIFSAEIFNASDENTDHIT